MKECNATTKANTLLNLNRLKELRISDLEDIRKSRVLVLAASMLDMQILPTLYNTLLNVGHCPKLDVVLYGKGGEINAARRIALLLHEFTDQLTFFVPHHCESAFTLLSLSGHSIVGGILSMFSPIDPGLSTYDNANTDQPDKLESEDIRLFCEMAENWFDVNNPDVKVNLLSAISSSIFPSTLTSLYRSNKEVTAIANELLQFQLYDHHEEVRNRIVNSLVSGYHSHAYSLTAANLKALGINISTDEATQSNVWSIAQVIDSLLGGGARASMQDPRNDVILATKERAVVRQNFPDSIMPCWTSIETNK
ncbi:MAG: hypothetical protein ACI9T7_000403 [Oleiphilaceae bacterium]|jgi:hypothetical protein